MTSKKSIRLKSDIKRELSNKTILITGGGGSLGSHLTRKILEYPVKAVRALDIDEHALFRLGRSITDSRLRLLLGNVADGERIDMAGNGVDIIFHTAAIKNLEISEYNPIETIETNINGTVNMIKMAMKNRPKKFLNISTDKAAEPSTLYGSTKQLGEILTSWAGNHIQTTKFATVRFGNIFETRGNVFEVWSDEVRNNQPISVTDPTMTRYFIHMEQAVDFILGCLSIMNEGEVFIPKLKLFKLKDMASKVSNKQKIIGMRRGEKKDEILITNTEMKKAIEKNDMWIINPYK